MGSDEADGRLAKPRLGAKSVNRKSRGRDGKVRRGHNEEEGWQGHTTCNNHVWISPELSVIQGN